MNRFGIAFDFPDGDDPWFASWIDGSLGLSSTLKHAATWDTEDVAERFLSSYGDEIRECGVVVEVGQ